MKLSYYQSERDKRLQQDKDYAWSKHNANAVANAADSADIVAIADAAIASGRNPLLDGYPPCEATFFLGIAFLPSYVKQDGNYPTWEEEDGTILLKFPSLHVASGAIIATIKPSKPLFGGMLKLEHNKAKEYLFPLSANL